MKRISRIGVYTLDQFNAADLRQRISDLEAEAVLFQTPEELQKSGHLDGLVVDVDGLRFNGDALTDLDELPCPVTAFSTYDDDWTLSESWRREEATIHRTVGEALDAVLERLGTTVQKRKAA